jgi:hypothetical protein
MKITLGLAAVLFFAAVPAHAQSRVGSVAATQNSGGGGGYGGGSAGSSGFSGLPHYAAADLRAIEVSGDESTYLPSTFMPFEKAVAQGYVVVKEESKTVAQAAAENRKASHLEAKARLVQDDRGRAVLALE